MIVLKLPPAYLEISNQNGQDFVFDIIRKKLVRLTDEEWVRQHFIHLLIQHLHYPKGLISIERGLKYNRLQKRTDIVVYDRQGSVYLTVECKSPKIKLNQGTFEQLAAYCFSSKSKYAVLTNGIQHFCYLLNHDNQSYSFLEKLPSFS